MNDIDQIEKDLKDFTTLIDTILIGGAAIVLSCALVYFALSPNKELVERETVMVEFRGIDPPKHVYADIFDYNRNTQLNHVYVSKHFNGWRKLTPNTDFKTLRLKYKNTTSDLSKAFGNEDKTWFSYEYPCLHDDLNKLITP